MHLTRAFQNKLVERRKSQDTVADEREESRKLAKPMVESTEQVKMQISPTDGSSLCHRL